MYNYRYNIISKTHSMYTDPANPYFLVPYLVDMIWLLCVLVSVSRLLLWMGVCLWRCTWVCAGYVCVGRSASGVVPQKPSTSFPIGMHQVGWRAGQWILGILLSPLLSMRTASVDHSTWLFMPVLGIEPRASWYAVSSKPVEPSAQPHFFS